MHVASHRLVEACIKLRYSLKDRHADVVQAVELPKGSVQGSMAHSLKCDLDALDAVSTAIALDQVPDARSLVRVEEVMAREGYVVALKQRDGKNATPMHDPADLRSIGPG